MEEIKTRRYYIAIRWIDKQMSYIESACLLNSVFKALSKVDNLFEEINLISNPGKPNVKLFYTSRNSSLSDNEFAEILFKRDKYWIKKLKPDTPLNVENRDYPRTEIFTLKGKPLEHIKIHFSVGNVGTNEFSIEFPRILTKDFEWYKQILLSVINVFKPDYGGLYPIIIQKLDPPLITAGWISYFSNRMSVDKRIFNDCTKISVLENEFIYAIEDQHMIRGNDEQDRKLSNMVDIFKQLNKTQTIKCHW